jgi:tripartite-type tricarboxylate transporter receptor subunit TctC
LLNLRVFALMSALPLLPHAAHGQGPDNYPIRPISLVVTVAPGGGADVLARIIAPKISESLRQAVVVENKVGASGVIGSDYVAKATPNGYTLMLLVNSFTITPALYKNLPFDPVNDFAAITRIATTSYSFAINPRTLPVKDVKDFITAVKASPGKYTYATPGKGTAFHLAVEVMKQQLGLEMLHVPHKDLGGALTSIVGGSTDAMFATSVLVQPQTKSGALRILAVTGSKRSPVVPDVPTFHEAGINFLDDVDGYYGVMAPAKTPREVISRLNREIITAMALSDVSQKVAASDLVASTSTPEQFAAQIKTDIQRWGQLIKDANISAD